MRETEPISRDDEVEVRYVNGVREVRTLRPFVPEASGSLPIRENGVYLITGGLGGLGLIFARYFVHEHHARVVLMGRSPLDRASEQRIREFDANVIYVQGDVCSEADVNHCMRTAKNDFGPIQGVIHAAGLHRDAFIRNKQVEEAAEVIRPKTIGVAVLDKATADEPLDFFVAFSSVAGVSGNVGQCDYAYANAYLDAFIATREELHAQGQRRGKSLSINWPLWKEGGMRLDEELEELKTAGLLPLDTAEGIRIFKAALATRESQVAAVVMHPEREAVSPPARTALAPRSKELGAIGLLTERFSQLTKIPRDRIKPNGPLDNYGIDSILVMSFTKLLEKDFGALSKTLLFEYQTLGALAGYFEAHHAQQLEEIFGGESPEPKATPQTLEEVVRPVSRPAPSSEDGEEVAIVGLFGRFPMAENPQEFWSNLAGGRDCIVEVPSDRWDYRKYYDAKPSGAGKTYNRWGGYLTDVDKFDSVFFRIPPREAERMDPQERLFLETVWNTLEDAGYRKSDLREKSVGVFVGVMYGQYQLVGLEQSRPGRLLSLGSSYASIANRVSYFFDWNGPSMAVDTMCSSSLTAIHLACESIRKGESELAVAGGVNLALHPLKDVGLAQGGFAAEDGRCKSFSAAGDGYVPGEGVGAVLLKPKSRAVADGDHIYAVIKAICINHGGKTNGYSVPNPNAQAKVIAGALNKANIDPRTITYLEAHGTGTSLGDPIEITGLGQGFRIAANGKIPQQFCAIGSAKSNIGHLEAAAGVAGLTKVLLQIQHRQLAPSLHSKELNPYILFDETPFAVQREAAPWKTPNGDPRRAGVSSFGAGGSNAHIIVEECVEPATTPGAATAGPQLFVLSAANADRLAAVAQRFRGWVSGLAEENRPDLADVAFTLQAGREGLDERLAFSVSSWEELAARLGDFLASNPAAEVFRGSTRDDAGRSESLLEGEEGRHFLDLLIRNRNLEKLAHLWVSGVEIDWETMWRDQSRRRVSLPVYPFARVRHWVTPPWEPVESASTPAARLGPLVHWNESTLKEQRFGSCFDEVETVIKDHEVNGQPMLPGAATVEMALQAIELATGTDVVRLHDIVWLRPFVAGGDGVEVRLALNPTGPEELSFQFRDVAGGVSVEGKATLGAVGEARRVAPEEIKARCPRRLEPAELYRGFAARGLSYGPGFQSIREIGAGEGEVWSLLELPEEWEEQQHRLHPALLDGALQSLAMISNGDDLEIPFAVKQVTCLAPLPTRCFAHGETAGEDRGLRRYDVGIFDEAGELLTRVEGVMTRPYGSSSAESELLFYRPAWKAARRKELTRPASGPILLFDENDDLARELERLELDVVRACSGPGYSANGKVVTLRPDRPEDYEELLRVVDAGAIVHLHPGEPETAGIISLHLLTQAVMKSGRPLLVVHVYPSGEATGEAVGAYAKSLRLEQPNMRLKALGVENENQATIVLDELRDEAVEVKYQRGERLVRTIEEIFPESGGANLPIERGGAYLVTGGLGGLGLIFAAKLIEEFDARVLLVGRSALDATKKQQLKPFGDRAVYMQADISRVDESVRVVEEAKERYGRLDGVFHASGALRDSLIWNKTPEEFDAVLRPKLAGVDALDAATKDEPLSLFVLFSSTAGLFGNVGQADYAYANGYLDAFARRRERQRENGTRHGRTLSINWPLWSEGGMRGDAKRANAIGMLPLDRASGWEIFKRALASDEAQIWGCLGDRAKIREWLRRTANSETKPVAESAPSPQAESGLTHDVILGYLVRQFAELTKLPTADIFADEPIENYGLDSIMVTTFAQMLEQDLGELSKTILFEYPTLGALGDYLLENHAAAFDRHIQQAEAGETSSRSFPAPVADSPPPGRFLMPADEPALTLASAPEEDPIAIIGVSGRYPMANDLDAFWENLAAGKDCIEEVPSERWDLDEIYDPERMKPGKTNNKWGGFINDVDTFDPLFFNIAPFEARFMDPQERMFLETVWHTLEDAGCAKSSLDGRKVGVFVGAMYGHYQLYGVEQRLKGNPVSLSSSFSTIANRVSYFFNWHGPSMAVDTMCSSSLTTIHLACESLKRGECELAVAGGVNATIHPEKDLILSQSGFSSSDGRCKTFGEGGDGYVPGEGVGALLLKPLSHAVADGNRIHGVIKASALNHGGKTNGYTVPNSRSQAEAISSALRQSKVDPTTITYVEAHGTGTSLGDPIEIEGLQQAFSEAFQRAEVSPDAQFCAIGSVKSNIGHCESAAGIAGVTKVLLQLKHGQLAPSIHAETLNPRIKFDATCFRVQRVLEPWEPLRIDGARLPRRAGVSSFGAGGANAHLILEEFIEAPAAGVSEGPELMVLSARNEERLKKMAVNMGRFLSGNADHGSNGDRGLSLRDIAFTLQSGREALEERLALVASDLGECVRKLTKWAAGGEQVAGIHRGSAKRSPSPVDEGSPPAAGDLDAWAARWVAGAEVDWAQLRGDTRARLISLPAYPFLRQRFWVPNQAPTNDGNGAGTAAVPGPSAEEFKPNAAHAKSTIDFSLMFFSDNNQVTDTNKYRLVLEAAKYADEHGFDGIWTPERHFHPFGGVYSSPSVLMAGLATVTRQIRLRAGSVVLPLKDPLRVAEEWAVVDNLSGGRVDIAFASGWSPNDFALAPENHARLREIWLERIPEVQQLWAGEEVERVNGNGETVNLRIYPQPLQKQLPVWLTASRRVETFIDAGKNGYNVLTMLQGSTLDQLSEKIARYREARAEAGFDPEAGKVTLMLHTLLDADAQRARELVREPFVEYIISSLDAHKTAMKDGAQISGEDLRKMAAFSYERYCREASLIGDPAGCMEMVRGCHAVGVNEISCLVDFGADTDDVLASLPALVELRELAAAEFPAAGAATAAVAQVPSPADIAAPFQAEEPEEPSGRFFTLDWMKSAVEIPRAGSLEAILLIHSAESPLNDAIVTESHARSAQRVRLGEQSRRIGENNWEVDLSDPGAIEWCLQQLVRPDLICFTGSIGLQSSTDAVSRVDNAQQASVIACVRLIQAMHSLGWLENPPAIRVVTAGSFEVTPDEAVCPDGSGMPALVGSLAKELPDLDIACVDIDPLELDDPALIPYLSGTAIGEPRQRDGEIVALRAGERWRQRLRLTEFPEVESASFRNGGVYLIVGGAGNVGQVLSRQLARKFGARLVLTGRRARDGKIDAQIARVRQEGGDALYVQARGEELAEMRAALELAVREFGQINGVIHSAMVMQNELVRKIDEQQSRRILDSKTKGSAVLFELTRDLPLDFLLFIGSAQSFFREARRGIYAAACSFSDAYARVIRQQVSFPVQVIHWGFWAHSLDDTMRRTVRSAGLGVVHPSEGFDAIERILNAGPVAAGFLSANPQALWRMGIDPAKKVIYLAEQNEGGEQMEDLIVSQLFK